MMIDGHMHMVLDGVYWKEAIARHCPVTDLIWVRGILERYRKEGFTWLRDGGDRWGVSAAARAVAGEYGITYRTPLSPLYLRGHYGGIIGVGFENLKEYATLVGQLARDGADFVKIMISGLMDLNAVGVLTQEGLPERVIQQMIHIAHEEGFAVMAHANGARTMEAAAAAGVDSIEHGAYADGEALAAMAEQGTVWVPTLSTLAAPIGKGRFSDKVLSGILERAMENVADFYAMGGLVAPGTDAGAWAVYHGTQLEYELLQKVADPGAGAKALMARF